MANVEEAMEESESLVGLEPTWEEMKDQLLVCFGRPFSCHTHVHCSGHCSGSGQLVTEITEDAYEHSHVIERLIEKANVQILFVENRAWAC